MIHQMHEAEKGFVQFRATSWIVLVPGETSTKPSQVRYPTLIPVYKFC